MEKIEKFDRSVGWSVRRSRSWRRVCRAVWTFGLCAFAYFGILSVLELSGGQTKTAIQFALSGFASLGIGRLVYRLRR